MNKNFTDYSIGIITFAYVVIIFLIIQNSCFSSDVIKDISLITSSFFTLTIALLLFDRFDYRKKIFEKKLDATLTLLSELKSTKIKIYYKNNINKTAYGGSPFLIDKKLIDLPFLKEHIDFNAKVVFEANNFFKYLEQINLHRANPFMPKEIVKSLDFLSIGHLKAINNDKEYQDKNIQISINNKAQNIIKDEEWCKPSTEMEFETFITNYINILDSIEFWINKHSNFKADLNL